jgi:hypothetical protein
MDISDLLAHRTPLIGAVVAAAVGLAGGLVMRTGPQVAPDVAPEPQAYAIAAAPSDAGEPIVWPAGQVPDYVIGTDFVTPPQPEPAPEVVASEPLPYEDPVMGPEPEPEPESEPEQLAVVDAPPAPILQPQPAPPAPIAVAALP